MTCNRTALRGVAACLLGLLAVDTKSLAATDPSIQPGGWTHGAPGAQHKHADELFQILPILDGVDATKEQHASIHALFKRTHEQSDHLFDHLLNQEHDIDEHIMLQLRTPGPVDRAALQAELQPYQALRAKTELISLDEAIEIHNILTPNQLDQARTKAAQTSAATDGARGNSHAEMSKG